MRLLRSIADLSSIPGPLALGIGVFDGVHLGHQKVIECALAKAKSSGGTATIVTFDPHPLKILRPENAPRLLTSTPHKLHLIESLGIDHVLLVHFDAEFAATAPEVFITQLADQTHSLHSICVGEEWSFGRERRGNVALLRKLGTTLGFSVDAIPAVQIDGQTVSSTLIRQQIEAGQLDEASRYLGHPFTILGTVLHGQQLGRKLGFPTANLSTHNEQFPPDGVYAVTARLGAESFPGVANIGFRPSVEDTSPQRRLEIHLFDFHRDIYESDLEIFFAKFLRPEQKFPSLEALQKQIRRDTELSRDFFAINPTL